MIDQTLCSIFLVIDVLNDSFVVCPKITISRHGAMTDFISERGLSAKWKLTSSIIRVEEGEVDKDGVYTDLVLVKQAQR